MSNPPLAKSLIYLKLIDDEDDNDENKIEIIDRFFEVKLLPLKNDIKYEKFFGQTTASNRLYPNNILTNKPIRIIR